MINIPNDKAEVKKEMQRLYREDIKKIHRKESKRQSRLLAASGQKKERYNATYVLSILQIIKLIMFQTYLGEEPKFTCREWLVNDLNRLRSPDEKQMSPRSIQRPLSILCKTTINDVPLIKNSPQKTRFIDASHDVRFKTLGIMLEIPSIENMIQYYGAILFDYLSHVHCYLPKEEIRKKVINQMREFILRIPSENRQKHVDKFALLPVDNFFMWTNLRCNVDKLALQCRQICAFYTNTSTNTQQILNIPSVPSGISLNVGTEDRSTGVVDKSKSDRQGIVSDTIRQLAESFTGGTTRKEPPPGDKSTRKDGEPENCLDIEYSKIPEIVRFAVNTKIREQDERFNPIKHDLGRFKKATRDICASAISMLKGDLNANKAQVMGAAECAVLAYLEMAELYGFDERPVYWRGNNLSTGDPEVAKSHISGLKSLLKFY